MNWPDWRAYRVEVVEVEVDVVYIGCRLAADLWCVECALPSVLECDWAYADTETLRVIGRSTNRWCPECGQVTPVAMGSD